MYKFNVALSKVDAILSFSQEKKIREGRREEEIKDEKKREREDGHYRRRGQKQI